MKLSKLNQEEEYWFIRWIFLARKYKTAKKKIIELEAIINQSKDKSLIHKLQTENHRLEDMLALLRESFIPINKTKHIPHKKKK